MTTPDLSRVADVFTLMDSNQQAITDWMTADIKARLTRAIPLIRADAYREAATEASPDGTDAWLMMLADDEEGR